jgi:Ca2+-transporting ATPase
VPEAIGACRRAGIRVVMITGDHAATARAVAVQAGLDAHRLLTGSDVAALTDGALAREVKGVDVFARVRPEQKLRIVRALQGAGEIVAMTGDGVNDAPALKAADIGVAMGRRGTDVAREAASLVLLEDDFTALVGTVRLGRRIYENIRNAMRFLVAVHVPLAGMALLPLAAGWPVFLFPLHVVFLEFVIDPACTLVFEAEHSDAHVMDRPPRDAGEPLLDRAAVLDALLLGALVLCAALAVYGVSLVQGHADGTARALAFTTLVWGDLALIVAHRSQRLGALQVLARRNTALWAIAAGALCALGAVMLWPPAARLFRFEVPALADAVLASAAGIAVLPVSDFLKRVRARTVTGVNR